MYLEGGFVVFFRNGYDIWIFGGAGAVIDWNAAGRTAQHDRVGPVIETGGFFYNRPLLAVEMFCTSDSPVGSDLHSLHIRRHIQTLSKALEEAQRHDVH